LPIEQVLTEADATGVAGVDEAAIEELVKRRLDGDALLVGPPALRHG
jgi:hypothetical protein